MKKLITFSIACILWAVSFAQNASDIVGTWLTDDGLAKVQIFKTEDKYNGKIVWLKNPLYEDGTAKHDKNNPDKAKQGVPLMDLVLLKDFVFDKDKWKEGTIYKPQNGKTYSCTIKSRDGKLDVRGYVGFSLIGETHTWFKVADVK